jgi:CRISPR-associated protein Csa5
MALSMHTVKGELSKVFAVLLIEQGSYTYVDKLAQTTSRDLALYHIREALRDYNSLLNRGFTNNETKIIADSIKFQDVEKEIEMISKIASTSDLREIVSLISSQALAEAARIRSRGIYIIAVKIVGYLKQKGMFFEKAEDLKNLITKNKSEIVKDLGIEEDAINDVVENQSLLRYLSRGG